LLGFVVVGSAATFFGGGAPTPTAAATAAIPPAMLTLYQSAATTCPGLPWTVLAAIGTIESDNDQSTLPGVHSGANAAGAEGPMQFEPATFAAYDEPVPPGGADPPNPYDPTDAVYAAARLLCANGAANGTDLAGAIESYDHSSSYVAQVLALAQSYGGTTASLVPTGSGAGVVAAEWAMQQIGTPYVWGGEAQGVGFDCSGLVQAAYRAAGVALPRVAQNQYDATAKVVPDAPLAPGDLVFFGGGPGGIDHVGLYVGVRGGSSVMVDAPFTGADVRVERFPTAVGAAFGSLLYVGATRPS
jgi:cell wall-associated NlpC family hydrolase